MERSKIIIDQIKADMHNIQELVNILPDCKKTRYNLVQNTIKQLIKQIRYQKGLISNNVFKKHFRHIPLLFEVDPSEIEQGEIESISSFFGLLD